MPGGGLDEHLLVQNYIPFGCHAELTPQKSCCGSVEDICKAREMPTNDRLN